MTTHPDSDDADDLPTPAERRAELGPAFARLRRLGWTVRAIAAEFGVCSATVCKYTRGHPHRRTKLTAEQEAEVRRLRAAGAKLFRLARRFGVSTCTVFRVCKPDRPPPPPGKLTPEQVAELRALAATGRHTQKELAARFGVSQPTACNAIGGKTWKAAGGEPVRMKAKRKLNPELVRAVLALVAAGKTQREAAEAVGVEQTTVSKIARRLIWKWVTP